MAPAESLKQNSASSDDMELRAWTGVLKLGHGDDPGSRQSLNIVTFPICVGMQASESIFTLTKSNHLAPLVVTCATGPSTIGLERNTSISIFRHRVPIIFRDRNKETFRNQMASTRLILEVTRGQLLLLFCVRIVSKW